MTPFGSERLVLAVLAAAIVVGTAGFFAGVAPRAEPRGYGARAGRPPLVEGAPPAPTQAQLAAEGRGPNGGRFRAALARLVGERPALTDPVEPATEAAWGEAVEARAQRRAFDGAPPTIPHAIDQIGFPSCPACHETGVVIDGRTAPAMAHEPHGSCASCHVVDRGPAPAGDLAGGPPVDNAFEGVRRAGRGGRADLGAPPTIPHGSFMRERCESCHGVLGGALRSSHGCRQSCGQCHVPAGGGESPGAGPPPLRAAAGVPARGGRP